MHVRNYMESLVYSLQTLFWQSHSKSAHYAVQVYRQSLINTLTHKPIQVRILEE